MARVCAASEAWRLEVVGVYVAIGGGRGGRGGGRSGVGRRRLALAAAAGETAEWDAGVGGRAGSGVACGDPMGSPGRSRASGCAHQGSVTEWWV
jgi:hypothetical protein